MTGSEKRVLLGAAWEACKRHKGQTSLSREEQVLSPDGAAAPRLVCSSRGLVGCWALCHWLQALADRQRPGCGWGAVRVVSVELEAAPRDSQDNQVSLAAGVPAVAILCPAPRACATRAVLQQQACSGGTV